MAKNNIPAEITKLSFEDALEQLEDIVRELEEGAGELDVSIKAYERGAHLKRHCEAKLKEARQRVEQVVLGPDSEPGLDPVELD